MSSHRGRGPRGGKQHTMKTHIISAIALALALAGARSASAAEYTYDLADTTHGPLVWGCPTPENFARAEFVSTFAAVVSTELAL